LIHSHCCGCGLTGRGTGAAVAGTSIVIFFSYLAAMPFQFPAIGNVVAFQVKPPLLEYAPTLVPNPMETTLLKGFA
jgi:hypothetical protein